ncbi:MAG: hypothetical protein ABJB40_01835, partial [Acidobacteriota bacterium]
MRKQFSGRGFRVIFSLVFVGVMFGAFLKYSETASSQKERQRQLPPTSDFVGKSSNGPVSPGGFVSHAADGFAVTPPVAQLTEPKVRITSKKYYKDEEKEEKETERREIGPTFQEPEEKVENDLVKRPIPGLGADKGDGLFTDPLLKQNNNSKLAPTAMPTPNLTFAGITHTVGTVLPPDTNGDVGPNHYIQTTNSDNAGATAVGIYNKSTGAVIATFGMASLFQTLQAADLCRTHDDGDPIVLYDPLADRWMISQFALETASTSAPSRQCIAISQTADPTGSYFVYSFAMPDGGTINDYPHFGVWSDAYYMTDNQFNDAGTAFLGAGIFAFDRTKMLAGDPTATYVYKNVFTIDAGAGGMLPTDIDGIVAPPTGLPEFVMEFRADEFGDPLDAIRLYQFVPNFATPAASTLVVLPDATNQRVGVHRF